MQVTNMENNGANKGKRLHFGVLVASLDDTSQCAVLEGVAEYARQNDIQLTVYVGTYQTIDHQNILLYEACFSAIRNSQTLDGLVLFSGYIAQNFSIENIQKEISEFSRDIPTVSISFAVPGIPSVLVDNVSGFFSAVDHLIKVHDKRKIALVRGPQNHTEADDRFVGYKLALAQNKIEFDERYVLQGDFSTESGINAVTELIDKRGLDFDAIAVSDDGTAIGVIRELKRRDYLIPTGVAVTGFDDDKGSDTFIPTISTVQQDFNLIGSLGMENLHKMTSGIRVDELTTITPVFLPRQSCGCLEGDILELEPKSSDIDYDIDSLFSFVYNRFLTIFHDYAPAQEIQGWVSALVGKTIEWPFNRKDYLRLFDEVLVNYNHYSEDYSPWQEAISVLTLGVELHTDEIECTKTVLSALIRATSLVHYICLRCEKNIEFSLDEIRMTRRRVASHLASVFDVDLLADELHRMLPILGFSSAMIGLYHEHITTNDHFADRSISTLIGFEGDMIINVKDIDKNKVLYSEISKISEFGFENKRRTLFFFPLFFEDEEMGIVLLPYDKDIPIDTYETLRINLSSAVKGAQLLARIQALSVTDELTGLLNRRGFYQFAMSRLHLLSRNPDMVTVVLILDMDGLKNINDFYGHSEGDVAISAFAGVLKKTLREVDIIGRLGGDEFVIFSTVRYATDDQIIIRRIRENIDEYNNRNSHPFKLSASIGSVVLVEPTKECLESAIQNADSILYKEKSEKRSRGFSRG